MPAIHEHLFDVEAAKRRLQDADGGYEIVHTSPGLEVGVYVLVAPEPDRQQPLKSKLRCGYLTKPQLLYRRVSIASNRSWCKNNKS
jgi:hypothetical protein